jgi:hypothetical protein
MRPLLFAFLFEALCSVAFAQGGSAVITLVMPPPAGDGYSALQSGAALAHGAADIYYNPALLSDLQRSTGSQLFYTESRQKLLPPLRLDDLYQRFHSGAIVMPDTGSGADLAVGFFRNEVNFGANNYQPANGGSVESFNSHETVYGAGIAVRLGIPVSVGANAKFYASHLADIHPGIQPACNWAFDLGVLTNPRLSPAAGLGWPAITLTPSLGLVMRNLGPDVFYGEPWQADPIPTTYTTAYGLRAEAFDFAEFEAGADMDYEWTRRSENLDQVRNLGYSVMFLAFRYSAGWLDDPSGKRFEKHVARSLDINFLRLYRCFKRIASGDLKSPSSSMDAGYPFAFTHVLGIPFRSNPRLEAGFREIESRDDGIRDGQKSRYYLNVSL